MFTRQLLLNVFAISLISLPSLSLAQTVASPEAYDCQVILIAKDLKTGYAEFKFQAFAKSSGTHGGEPTEFTQGVHRIAILSNARWLGINWFRGEETVTEVVFARGDDSTAASTLISYNPKDNDEQVSVNCTPKAMAGK